MRFLIPFLLLLAAGCGRDDPQPDNRAAPGPAGPAAGPSASPPAAGKGSGARLAGLYEGGSGAEKSQLCIVEKGREAQFGLIVWGGNLHSCSGAGRAARSGERLTLTMTGDETCTVNATLKDGTVTLPATLPTGCAYYCGARATFAGARFTRSGEDVRKARDIAGDPLCD
ncbi:MAG TPA: hypothetical protein VGB04_09095 [Allosphingosinicella sp.]|jgi:hypothetical protein